MLVMGVGRFIVRCTQLGSGRTRRERKVVVVMTGVLGDSVVDRNGRSNVFCAPF